VTYNQLRRLQSNSKKRRVLLVMIQPPGCSGVQALIYNKLLPFTDQHGWEFHFAGPAPWLVSRLTEQLNYPTERLHYTTNISPSLRFSVQKNRHSKSSPSYLFFGFLQLLSKIMEKLLGHNSEDYLLRGLEKTVRQAESRWSFDLIAGKTPEFKILNLIQQVTRSMRKPFMALIDDPHGARDESGFYPSQPDLQREILDQSCGALFMSPLTRNRYVEAGLVCRDKAHYVTDSYPELPQLYEANRSALALKPAAKMGGSTTLKMIYLGMLPEWRPIEPFLDAIQTLAEGQEGSQPSFQLSIFGFVYPAAKQRMTSDAQLASLIQIHPMVSYGESHWLAEDADIQLVVIGPRHIDNYPSKFFEYLAHQKPVLVLGPLENPLRAIVNGLRIGLYVDSRDTQAILNALAQLQKNYGQFKRAYQEHAQAIEAYSAHHVAEQFCHILDGCMVEAKKC
jgi:glycosyltransferase involved in cell wall biosynthesis